MKSVFSSYTEGQCLPELLGKQHSSIPTKKPSVVFHRRKRSEVYCNQMMRQCKKLNKTIKNTFQTQQLFVRVNFCTYGK